MQTNFDFLVQTDRFKDFAMQAAEAERSIAISPSTAAILSRRALELAVRWVYVHDDALTMPYRDNISSLIHEYSFRKLIQPKLFDMLKYTIKLGNVAVHTNTNVKHDAAVLSLRCVFQFCKWIDYCYGENYINRHYDMSLLPDAGKEKKTQEELENLQKELSGKDQKLEEAIKVKIQKQRQEENTLTLILRKLDGRLARTVLQKCQLQVCQTVQEKVMPIMFYTAIMENHWQSSKQNEAV